MSARFPSVVDLGANDESQVDVSHNNTSSYLEMLVNKFDRAPDAAQAVASATSVAKAESIPQPAPWTDMIKENRKLVKQNQVMAELNHALVIVVQQAKSREQRAAHCYEVLEKYVLPKEQELIPEY